jgi:hypothetical protein
VDNRDNQRAVLDGSPGDAQGDGIEFRRHRRHDTHGLSATLHLGADARPVAVRDLSLSGACIESAPPDLSPGDPIVLEAVLGAYGEIVATCEIVRVTRTEDGSVLGVRFIMMSQEDTNHLLFFLHSLEEQETGIHGGW